MKRNYRAERAATNYLVEFINDHVRTYARSRLRVRAVAEQMLRKPERERQREEEREKEGAGERDASPSEAERRKNSNRKPRRATRRVANLTGKYLDCRIHGIDTSSGVYVYVVPVVPLPSLVLAENPGKGSAVENER